MSPQDPTLGIEELRAVVRELEMHAAGTGWDQSPQIFALVDTADLRRREPQLAQLLGAEEGRVGLTPVEQDALEPGQELEDLLAEIMWPPEVSGCAVVVERLLLPPEAEAEAPVDAAETREYAAAHPDREEVRIIAAVLRPQPGSQAGSQPSSGAGHSWCALRMRSHDEDASVLIGPDLVPMLVTLLNATLVSEDELPDNEADLDQPSAPAPGPGDSFPQPGTDRPDPDGTPA